jgi:hypothetical protein
MISYELSKRLKKFKHKVFWSSGILWKGDINITKDWVCERWKEQHQNKKYKVVNVFARRT